MQIEIPVPDPEVVQDLTMPVAPAAGVPALLLVAYAIARLHHARPTLFPGIAGRVWGVLSSTPLLVTYLTATAGFVSAVWNGRVFDPDQDTTMSRTLATVGVLIGGSPVWFTSLVTLVDGLLRASGLTRRWEEQKVLSLIKGTVPGVNSHHGGQEVGMVCYYMRGKGFDLLPIIKAVSYCGGRVRDSQQLEAIQRDVGATASAYVYIPADLHDHLTGVTPSPAAPQPAAPQPFTSSGTSPWKAELMSKFTGFPGCFRCSVPEELIDGSGRWYVTFDTSGSCDLGRKLNNLFGNSAVFCTFAIDERPGQPTVRRLGAMLTDAQVGIILRADLTKD